MAFTPSPYPPALDRLNDKFNHLVAFFTLSFFYFNAFSKKISYLIFIMLMFGIFIEIIQFFIPNRSSSILDIIADMIGVVMFVGFVKYKNLK
ncbi:MAG: VanZ family protein [Campylobacterales bacterium]|nr:VanZ family protein [Campylobacterales bacterium]